MVDSLLPGEREAGLLNCFALVSYLPDQLGRFLDELRRDVEPNTLAPRAHLTLLPPRSLTDIASAQAAERYLEMMLAEISAVEIILGSVEVFPVTNVVYVAVDDGFLQMRKLHERLNSGPVGFAEPFHYHPHITLAQGLTAAQALRVKEEAASRWSQFPGSRGFSTDSFSFVQANCAGRWVDLAEYALAPAGR